MKNTKPIMENELLKNLASAKDKRSKLIPILQEVQAKFGYLPEEVIHEISAVTGIPESEIYSVATFYAQFRLVPVGRKRVSVCRGTPCHVKGAPKILEAIEKTLGIKEDETTPDLEYSLESVGCIGCCALAPCIKINEQVYGLLTPRKVQELFTSQTIEEGKKDV